MKSTFALIGVLILVVQAAFGQGAAVIIKERAKELSNQNNVRQGVASPAPAAPAAQSAAPGAPARPLTPQEQALARLQSDLAGMKPDAPISTYQRQQFAKDLIGASQGAAKPSQAAVNKLALDLSSVLGEKLLATVTLKRLVQDFNTILNPSTVGAAQLKDVVADVQAIFQANNVDRKDAVAIANDAQAIANEVKKAAAAQ
jgi:hypothetical protein